MSCYIFPTSFGYSSIAYQIKPFLIQFIRLPGSFVYSHNRQSNALKPQCKEAETIGIVIQNYYHGKMFDIPWHWMSLKDYTPLQQEVYKETSKIPWGKVQTYQQIAQRINSPKAYRFVGSCMANNPYPIIIPCHRVIRSNGSLGQFGGGINLKKSMLLIEQGLLPFNLNDNNEKRHHEGAIKLDKHYGPLIRERIHYESQILAR